MSQAHDEQRCGGPGLCPECNQAAVTGAFETAAGKPAERCSSCGQEMPDQPVRMTEEVRHGS